MGIMPDKLIMLDVRED